MKPAFALEGRRFLLPLAALGLSFLIATIAFGATTIGDNITTAGTLSVTSATATSTFSGFVTVSGASSTSTISGFVTLGTTTTNLLRITNKSTSTSLGGFDAAGLKSTAGLVVSTGGILAQGAGTGLTVSNNSALGTVISGTWNGTAIGSQYGGTGGDFSGSTGFLSVTGGTASASSSITIGSLFATSTGATSTVAGFLSVYGANSTSTFNGFISLGTTTTNLLRITNISTSTSLGGFDAAGLKTTAGLVVSSGSILAEGAGTGLAVTNNITAASTVITNATTTTLQVSSVATTSRLIISTNILAQNPYATSTFLGGASLAETGGTVGVGTSSPARTLGVNGGIFVTSNATTTLQLYSTLTTAGTCIQMVNPAGTMYRIYVNTANAPVLVTEAGACQ